MLTSIWLLNWVSATQWQSYCTLCAISVQQMHVVKSAMSTAYNVDLPTISEDAASAVIVAIAPCAMEPIKSPADSSFSAKLRAFSVLVNFDSMACVTVPDCILYKFAHFVTFDYSRAYSITKTLALFLNFSLICSHTGTQTRCSLWRRSVFVLL